MARQEGREEDGPEVHGEEVDREEDHGQKTTAKKTTKAAAKKSRLPVPRGYHLGMDQDTLPLGRERCRSSSSV